MKKNLRNILTLTLGLMTTSVFAQDWNVDSRTRINMHGDNGMMLTEQRATVGATWGGSDWGIHVSSDVDYAFGNWDGTSGSDLKAEVYEAYASANLMGYATLTAGRQALDYGSGAIISSNQWGSDRNTWDGLKFDLDVDVADITIGYAAMNDGAEMDVIDAVSGLTTTEDVSTAGRTMYANLNKSDGDWSANLLVVRSGMDMGGEEVASSQYMGLDVTYAMMDGKLDLGVSYNTGSTTINDVLDVTTGLVADETTDIDMMSLSASYAVNENLSATVNRTTYGENGFASATGGDYLGSWTDNGTIGYLGADDQNTNIGVSYSMDKFTLGATMHTITSLTEDDAATLLVDESDVDDRNVTEFSIGYAMSDNATLSLKYASDEVGDADAEKYMWVTLNVNP